MAATLTQERFAAPGWVFERKLDGIRLLAFKDRYNAEWLIGRHGHQTPAAVRAAFAADVAA